MIRKERVRIEQANLDRRVLAKNLMAAVLAWKLGIGLDYAKKAYVLDKPVTRPWLHLAEAIIRGEYERLSNE